MAHSVPPGILHTQPNATIVFNGPFDVSRTYNIKVTNTSIRRVGWAIKANKNHITYDRCYGVLDPKEASLIAVTCEAFAYDQDAPNNHRITIEWTNTPDGAAKQFRREWFEGDGYATKRVAAVQCTERMTIRSTRATYDQPTEASRRKSIPKKTYVSRRQ